MPTRRRAREQALALLYFVDASGTSVGEAVDVFRSSFDRSVEDDSFALNLVRGVLDNLTLLDERIEAVSDNWRLQRMPGVDRAILRMGAFELMVSADTPGPAVINEAVELAKKYADGRSGAFVNGVLDRIFRNLPKKV